MKAFTEGDALMKSFGNGIVLLRFLSDQTPESATEFAARAGLLPQESVVGGSAKDVYVLTEEGRRVDVLDIRNTEDEWEDLCESVAARGGPEFKERLQGLCRDREAF